MNSEYTVRNVSELDSPALLIYKDIVEANILKMVEIAGTPDRLIPHVKTSKMVEVVQLLMAQGISKFKCSTIAEAEMVALAGASYALIAHQLVGPKIDRLLALTANYPATKFASLVDNPGIVATMQRAIESIKQTAAVYIDVNNGMNRSGAEVSQLNELITALENAPNVRLAGWHVYDGHRREPGFNERKTAIDEDFIEFEAFLSTSKYGQLPVIAGGSPAFTVHAENAGRLCSPGTSVFWDWGYGDRFSEQPFQYAALLLTRVISKPTAGIITIDLGHKAVAAENPIDKRVRFMNLENYELLSQSEEHGVLKVADWEGIHVGDELLAVPYHVCPTVNLYDTAYVVEQNEVKKTWKVVGRSRKISV